MPPICLERPVTLTLSTDEGVLRTFCGPFRRKIMSTLDQAGVMLINVTCLYYMYLCVYGHIVYKLSCLVLFGTHSHKTNWSSRDRVKPEIRPKPWQTPCEGWTKLWSVRSPSHMFSPIPWLSGKQGPIRGGHSPLIIPKVLRLPILGWFGHILSINVST